MKKLMLALAACVFSLAGYSEDTKVATRAWVLRQLANLKSATATATATDNGDGTVTVEGPYTLPGVQDCVSISFTVQKPQSASSPSTVRLRPSLLSLFIPMAYAEVLPDGTIQVTISGGFWRDSVGNIHEFDFGGGWTIAISKALPEKPSSTHTCVLDEDCFCVDYGVGGVEVPSEYEDITGENYDDSGLNNVLEWLYDDNGNLPSFVHSKKVGKGSRERTVYYVMDDGGQEIDIDGICSSPQWKLSMLQVQDEINSYLSECRDAYIQAHTCKEKNPRHNWQDFTCGPFSWSVCSRNPDHEDGQEGHAGHTITGTCECGATSSPHDIVSGARVAKQGNTGWTQSIYCSKGCGLSSTKDHDCVRVNCGACTLDDCGWKCPTCNGLHNWGGQTAYSCVRCLCDGCGITEGEQTGGTVIITKSNHSGWHACSAHSDEENERGSGRHCVCECGTFGCDSNSFHVRDSIPVTYEAIDYHDHWRVDKSICLNQSCGDPYGVREEHDLTGDPEYEYVSNTQCNRVVSCGKNCGWENIEEGSHSPDGNPYDYTEVNKSICRWWYYCKNRGESDNQHTYYEDNQHAYDAGVLTVEASGGVIIKTMTYTCANCGCKDKSTEELPCYHAEVDEETLEVTELWQDCVCSNCGLFRGHAFGGDPITVKGKCPEIQCQNMNGDGSQCSATTNTVAGTHVGWQYLTESQHRCLCGLVDSGHEQIDVPTEFECIVKKTCNPTNGCGHVFYEIHTPDLVSCGNSVFCSLCGRKREMVGGVETWVEAGNDAHRWQGAEEADRTVCVCDCGLVTSHYFAPDRSTCGCQCGGSLSHIRGSNPTCKCTGEPSHSRVLIGHGALSTQTTSSTNRCDVCSKMWVDKTHNFICTVCNEVAGSSVEHGSHVCKGGYQQTAGTISYSWEAYDMDDGIDEETGEPKKKHVDAGGWTKSWSGGGGSGAPPDGAGAQAASSMSASGATIVIEQTGLYRLRAKIDDSGSVSVGGLSASGPYWAYGAWVEGVLTEGPVSVSASADSVGGVCGFSYELQFVGAEEEQQGN